MSFVGGQHDPKQFSNKQAPASDTGRGRGAAHSGPVHISTCWAVDSAEAMCNSFKANHPETEVACALATPFTSH